MGDSPDENSVKSSQTAVLPGHSIPVLLDISVTDRAEIEVLIFSEPCWWRCTLQTQIFPNHR